MEIEDQPYIRQKAILNDIKCFIEDIEKTRNFKVKPKYCYQKYMKRKVI